MRAVSSVNTALLHFYWELGSDILAVQETKQRWGSKFLEQLSHDLRISHPGMKGFSKRNLEYMRLLVIIYPNKDQFTQQSAAQLPSIAEIEAELNDAVDNKSLKNEKL